MLAVLGLDNRPQARAQFRRAPAAGSRATAPGPAGSQHRVFGTGPAPAPGGPAPAAPPAAAPTSYTPPQVAELYQFPAGTDGTGQTIAIIELGGGFGSSDLDPYFAGLGLPVPSVTAASVDGAVNQPGQDPNGADGEVLLDIEVAGRGRPGRRPGRLLRAQHRPGLRGRGDHRGARHPDARGGQHQLGAVRGLLDRPGPDRPGPGDGRRGRAGRHRLPSRPETTAAATARAAAAPTSTSPRPARTRWPAAGPACAATPRPA